MAERKRSTRTYSKRLSRAGWRPGRSEADSEKRSWRVGASSGRESSGMTKGSGKDAVRGFSMPVPNSTVAQTSSVPSSEA